MRLFLLGSVAALALIAITAVVLDRATISVVDQGCGMDAEVRTRIFDPFFTTRETGSGVGLGLTAAWGIVKRHGGFIDVQSQPGEGTTVRIALPAAAPRA